ncbi:hypothetical protein L6258_01355, partial [Candidatus Parcubacteria bacterium]|nr:hypothetical protein [Candidatus Parcubacteria bacterium]
MKKIINNPVLVGSGAVLAWTVWGNVSWGFWPLLILAVSLTIWFVATVATVVRQVGVEEKLSSGWFFIVFAVILFLACVVGAFFEID